MSLKIKTAARLKALFPGVALSKKSVEALGDQFAKAGLTDESTDEEIDAKINDRNSVFPFEDQKKFDDYQAGKAAKEKADKEAADKKAAEDGKTTELPKEDPDMPAWAKALIESNKVLATNLEAIKGEKVAQTRKQIAAEKLKDAPESFRNDVLADMDEITFRDDDHLNSYLERKVTAAADFVQAQSDLGLGNDRPTGALKIVPGQVKEASKEEVDLVLDKIM